MSHTLTENTTHDLWVEARQFKIEISRPAPTSIQLTIRRPAEMGVVDGALVLLGTRVIDPNDYPTDGAQFLNPSLVFGDPDVDKISDHQVVGFYSAILGRPFPDGTPAADGTVEWSITVTDTDPNTIYHASVHAASNVLQYYPLGIQSYPLESAQREKSNGSYTGSIPSLPFAPTSPTPGMVYFDQQLNLVQYWDAARSVWVPSRTDTIISGETNPGIAGQAYMVGGNILRVFDGRAWVQATPDNLQFATPGNTWVPFTSLTGSTKLPTSPVAGDLVYDYTSRRIQYFDGATWQVPSAATALFDTGASIIPAFTTRFTVEAEDLVTPYIGLLFYNTSKRVLMVWNGAGWEQANTDQQGTPTSDKIGIGNDGTYDQRLRLINVLKGQLGWPAQCVELSEEQFNIAIDNAVDTYRQLSIGAYEQRYMVFGLLRDQQLYFLNSPTDRTDAIVSVMKIHRMNLMGVNGAGPDNTWGMAFSQQFASLSTSGGALLDTHLMYGWSEEFTRMFAGDIPFVWNEARRELFMKRAIRQNEKVVLEVELERSEQELMSDRWCKQFIQNWALAECKEYLGLIRSKYSSGTPGPAGTITLNGETLLAEARQDFTELKQALLDYEHQNAEHGNVSFLLA